MTERDQKEPIERLRGLGEAIDRAISESRLKRAEYQDQAADELRELRRLLRHQTRRHNHEK